MGHLVSIPIRDNHGKLLPLKVYGKSWWEPWGEQMREKKREEGKKKEGIKEKKQERDVGNVTICPSFPRTVPVCSVILVSLWMSSLSFSNVYPGLDDQLYDSRYRPVFCLAIPSPRASLTTSLPSAQKPVSHPTIAATATSSRCPPPKGRLLSASQ